MAAHMIYEYRNTMERHDQATTTNHGRITPPPPPLVEVRVEVMAKVPPLQFSSSGVLRSIYFCNVSLQFRL
jgi:hypothetical protein